MMFTVTTIHCGGNMSNNCRCGFQGDGEHPCHGMGYSCKNPATTRFVTYPTALSGMQMKLGAYQTWACDKCWENFKQILKDNSDEK